MVLNPFLAWPSILLLLLAHQPSKEISAGRGDRSYRLCRTLYHTWREKTQQVNMWSIVSTSWSHSGQCSRWGNPLLAWRFVVQHLLCATNNHIKTCIYLVPTFSKFSPMVQNAWPQWRTLEQGILLLPTSEIMANEKKAFCWGVNQYLKGCQQWIMFSLL
jgi:hypothetical protein